MGRRRRSERGMTTAVVAEEAGALPREEEEEVEVEATHESEC